MKTEDILRYQAALGHSLPDTLVQRNSSFRKRYMEGRLWWVVFRITQPAKDLPRSLSSKSLD